jgi:hypothetical protein
MYQTIFVDKRIELTPRELSDARTTEHIRDILVTKLKEQEEGKCNAEGYIRPGSIQLLRRSVGSAENGKFTGNWVYDCKVRCEILKPVAFDPQDPNDTSSSMNVRVIAVNKAGVYAVFEEAIRVLLPRDLHVGLPAFESLKENDVVRVRMLRHRFQTNDKCILALGELYVDGAKPRGMAEQKEDEEEETEDAEETEETEETTTA